jgi:hypothetical protein
VRQLIARIDDDLHARLKRTAGTQKRSVNALVVEALEAAVEGADSLAVLRIRAPDLVVHPPRPTQVPTRREVEQAGRGAGSAVSEALADERSAR